MKSSDQAAAVLHSLEQDIERWSEVLSQLHHENKDRLVIEAKLADWRQKRHHLAKLFVAEVKQKKQK